TGATAPSKSDPGWQTYDSSSKPTLHDGEHLAYYSVDKAKPTGNEESVQHSRALSVDTQAPTTTDDVPATVQNGNRQVTLTAVDSGPAGVATRRSSVLTGATAPSKCDPGWATYDASSKPTLHDGEHLAYYSVDKAQPSGNEESIQHS